ncbi:MAG TPA: styrene monooxygenase/indole monooxygenase family protein [Trebonia sp.]|nr:styrene monooxygenase/indole monooxygenase family protein [Trebonia sp.]
MPAWLELFEDRGGRVIYHSVMTSDLPGLVPMYDLTVIAAGNGEIAGLFERDTSRTKFDRPGRHLAAIYLDGVAEPADLPIPRVRANIAPGEAETFAIPAYTHSGACDIMLVEAIPGSPWDVFTDRPAPAEHLRRLKALLTRYFPWEGELYADAEPTDARASLVGAFPTTIRHPYAEVAPGSFVLGIADVVVLCDPIAGQGANNAAHAAGSYLTSILERGEDPFDPEWMQATFDACWARAKDSVTWTEMMLSPLPQHVQQFLGAAAEFPAVADTFARFFPFPATLHDCLTDPAKTTAYLESVATARR